MKKRLFFSILMLTATLFVSASNWYVTKAGNDSNDGKSVAKAFLTLQKAADLVQPGDVVLVGNGLYTNDTI